MIQAEFIARRIEADFQFVAHQREAAFVPGHAGADGLRYGCLDGELERISRAGVPGVPLGSLPDQFVETCAA